MFHTFSFDVRKQEMRIATKAWSDFAAHIPLIRSFSYGPNLGRLLHGKPVESPLFPGEPIRYHYGFYALVGALERLGLRIDWAFNIPSALGFFLLLVLIFRLSQLLFTNYFVSFLSVLLFLFNGSFSFVKFFREHPLASITPGDVFMNPKFPSFGPWDGGPVTAFWNLNIFTNQRHLGLSYAVALTILLLMWRCTAKTSFSRRFVFGLGTGVLWGTLWFINHAVAAAIAFCLLFIIQHAWRNMLHPSFFFRPDPKFPKVGDGFVIGFGVVSLLLMPFILNSLSASLSIQQSPCYLSPPPFTVASCAYFWFMNLGLHTFLVPLGILLAPKTVRNFLLGPLLALFILPNLFRFSPDMINNHKFFNFFLIVGNMFSAYAIVRIFSIKRIGTLVGLVGLVGLMLSGIIDFFPIINDAKGGMPDVASNPDVRFFATQTKPNDIVANSTWFYHPASLAGRSMYSGYTYFTWSYGYDQGGREASLQSIYQAPDRLSLCQRLRDTNVAYIELNSEPEHYLQPNMALWDTLLPVYKNPDNHLRIYDTESLCDARPR